jgi:hypothetical protein
MTAKGLAMTPTPSGDETGGSMVFFGVLLLVIGWPFYFLPLIAIAVGVRRVRMKQLGAPEAPFGATHGLSANLHFMSGKC